MKRIFQNFRRFAPLSALVLSFGFSGTATAEQFRTNRGKVYHDCRVISHDAYGIMISHRHGAARLAFSDLSSAVQKRYKYDPSAAKQFVKRHTHVVPVRSSQVAHRRAIATHFKGFSPQLAATRAHLAFAGGLLGAPFCGSLGVPGLKSFDAWQTYPNFAQHNPYHSSHTYNVKKGHVVLNNRRHSDRFRGGHHYRYAYANHHHHFPGYYNPNSYLQNQVRWGVHIAPAMNGGHIAATNGGNHIAPAMMSYSQFQASRQRAISKIPIPRLPKGGGRPPVAVPLPAGGGGGGK